MSVTTTANPIHYNVQAVLADYDLHHSGEPEEVDTSLNPHPAPASTSENPSHWPTEYRRVPVYRPVNTELDQSERRVYLNGIERAFVGVMFTGVFLESVRTYLGKTKSVVLTRFTDNLKDLAELSRQSVERWVQIGW